MTSLQVNSSELQALKAEAAHWRRLALTDDLTGLYHRRAGDRIISRLLGWKAPFLLFSLDLNEFKPINDRAGHEAGDLVLKALATSFRAEADYVIRQGGDEFVAIVKCSAVEADGIYYRLKAAAASVDLDGHLPDEMKGHRCGVAIGWASSQECSIMRDLLALSDRRMYADKVAGKASQR
jgi:diguanylate cyclase (GGDEF)-like protein